jgi:hypothetical protein
MTELSTTFPRNRQGSPFAAELDRRLAGNESLIDIVVWWCTSYREWCAPLPVANDGGPSIMDLTEHEESVFCLGGVWSLVPGDEPLTEDIVDPKVQDMWDYVRKARAALQAKQ